MKALISPEEKQHITYISAWVDGQAEYSTIENCQRIAEVSETEFDVAQPLFWVDCPDDCVADGWYYKDEQIQRIPESVPKPEYLTEE
jgi:hypothetical protein